MCLHQDLFDFNGETPKPASSTNDKRQKTIPGHFVVDDNVIFGFFFLLVWTDRAIQKILLPVVSLPATRGRVGAIKAPLLPSTC